MVKKRDLENEQRLIGLSAESAEKLAEGFKASAEVLKDVLESLQEVTEEIENSKSEADILFDNVKAGGNIVKGLTDGLSKMAKKLDESGTLSNLLKGNFKEVFNFTNMAALGSAAFANTLIRGVIELDKLQTAFNKQFGLTDATANRLQQRFGDIARASGRTSINFLDISKAVTDISTATGILATGLRDDVIGEAAELQKLLGLSADQTARLAFNAQVTGQNAKEQTEAIAAGALAAERSLGVNLDISAAFKSAASTTGLIRANLGRNLETITRTVAKAQAFGLTLEDLAGISSNLLDFQSSIEAELTAELFIGRQLNLEKARLLALTGDYEGVQSEIVKQLGSESEFLAMNVLQKEKFAAALGMSADQLSNMIFKQTDLNSLIEQAEARGQTQLVNQLKQRDLAAQFNDIVQKIQLAFIDIAGGPIGNLASMLSEIAQMSEVVYGAFGLIAVLKFTSLVNSIRMIGLMFQRAGYKAAIFGAMTNPLKAGLGLLAAGAAIAGLSALFSKGDAEAAKVPEKSFADLGAEEMVTLEKGTARFHPGESLVRTENFGKMNDTLNEINNSIKQQKLSFVVETHHATRYR